MDSLLISFLQHLFAQFSFQGLLAPSILSLKGLLEYVCQNVSNDPQMQELLLVSILILQQGSLKEEFDLCNFESLCLRQLPTLLL